MVYRLVYHRFAQEVVYHFYKRRCGMPLTDVQIRKLKPLEKQYSVSDINGLSLLVKPNGSKLWRIRYTFDGKRNMMSAGA